MRSKGCGVRNIAAGLALFVLAWITYGFLLERSSVAAAPILWAIRQGPLQSGGLLTMVLGLERGLWSDGGYEGRRFASV
ncbi:MAG: hypothetical protein OYK82_13085 [Gammaproteobacteria bacterium]|nr:hypothetical protein [Gammaproteobacteria bacterium]